MEHTIHPMQPPFPAQASEEHNALETARLRLRRFTESDADALLAIYSDEETNTFLPWFPIKTISEAKAALQTRYLDAYAAGEQYRYAVCFKSDNVPIGYVHVSGDASHDLGYGLRHEFWHMGIITEACTTVLDKLRRDGIRYVTATHDVQNPRSGAVMRKLGMTYQYSYEEQWQPKDIRVLFRLYQLNLDGQTDRVYLDYWERFPKHFIEPNLNN